MKKEEKTSIYRKILNISIVIILLSIIVLLALYGNDFKEKIFALFKGDKVNKSFLLAFLGYLAVFIGTIVEGETVLFVSCLLCSLGYLSLPVVIIIATVGGSAGDNIYFHLVKENGSKLIEKSKHLQKWYPRVKAMVETYGGWAVVASRFLIGLRTAIALVCSSGKMSPLKFAFLNLLSAFLWATFYCCAIYYGGQTFKYYFETFKKFWIIVMPLLILIVILACFFKNKFSKKTV